MLSTAVYVIEVEKEVPTVDPGQSNFFSSYKQSIISTLISALANASNGGDPNILGTDLADLKTVILENSYQAMLRMDYSTLNSSGYQNGLLISWGANGQGISSACTSFVFASSGPLAASDLEYTLNVSSALNLNGNYHQINETTKQVHLTATVLNEAKAALAQNFTLSFSSGTDWVKVDSPGTTNFGNGTYTFSFTAETSQPTDPLVLSLLCKDQRGIFVGANLTCTNT